MTPENMRYIADLLRFRRAQLDSERARLTEALTKLDIETKRLLETQAALFPPPPQEPP